MNNKKSLFRIVRASAVLAALVLGGHASGSLSNIYPVQFVAANGHTGAHLSGFQFSHDGGPCCSAQFC